LRPLHVQPNHLLQQGKIRVLYLIWSPVLARLFSAYEKFSHRFNVRTDSLINIIFSTFHYTRYCFLAINIKSNILIHI